MAIDYANLLGSGLSAYLQNQSNKKYTNEYNNLSSTLRDTYTNPQSVYNSQYKAMDDVFYNKLQRQAAAEGRSTDVSKMGTAREAQFQNYLNQYRNSLSSQLNSVANNQQVNSKYNQYSPYTTVLGQLLAPTVGKNGEKQASPLNDAINGAIGSGINYISGMFGSSGQATPTPMAQLESPTYDQTGNLSNWWNQEWWNNSDNVDSTYSGNNSPVWSFGSGGTGA